MVFPLPSCVWVDVEPDLNLHTQHTALWQVMMGGKASALFGEATLE